MPPATSAAAPPPSPPMAHTPPHPAPPPLHHPPERQATQELNPPQESRGCPPDLSLPSSRIALRPPTLAMLPRCLYCGQCARAGRGDEGVGRASPREGEAAQASGLQLGQGQGQCSGHEHVTRRVRVGGQGLARGAKGSAQADNPPPPPLRLVSISPGMVPDLASAPPLAIR